MKLQKTYRALLVANEFATAHAVREAARNSTVGL